MRRSLSSWSISGGGISKKSTAVAFFFVFSFFFFPSSDLSDIFTVADHTRRMILFPGSFVSCSEITYAITFWHSSMVLFWASSILYFAPQSSASVFSVRAFNFSWSSLTSFSFSNPQMSMFWIV